MPAIETHSLTRKFGTLTAVDKLDLSVDKGEVLGFLGPNGAGKTTTIRMLAGIIAPTAGYAVIERQRTDRDAGSLHEIVGLLTEAPGFYDRLTAYRNLSFFAGFYRSIKDISGRVEKYLRAVGLWERRGEQVGGYSKGMKQRLAVARALLSEPQVLFLDEPTAGLDPQAAGEIRDLIRQLSREGRTIFLSTHNLAEAEQLCRRIAIFRTHLVAIDTPENLRRQQFSRRVSVKVQNPTDSITSTIRALPYVRSLEYPGDRYIITLTDTELYLPDVVQSIVQSGGRIVEVSEEKHSLEDVYLSLVKEQNR